MAVLIVTYDGRKFNPNTKDYHSFLAAMILNGSNARANEVLNSVGGIRSVPKIRYHHADFAGFSSISDVADFYGVDWKYLSYVFRDCGIIAKNAPNDVKHVRGDSIILDEGYIGRPANAYGVSVYSPRVVLATAVLLDVRKFPFRNHNAVHVYHAIRASKYGDDANESWIEYCKNQLEEERRKAEASLVPNRTGSFNNVSFDPALLQKLIEVSIDKVLRERISSFLNHSDS